MCTVNPDCALLTPFVIATFDYWTRKVRNRTTTARRDLDPCEIPSLLPWLILTDVSDNPLDFRYRLIGTQVVAQARCKVKRSLYIPPSSLYGPAPWTSATI
jgi:hypothetical protein